MKRVVITGVSGCIGRVLYDNLGKKWDFSGLDIRESPGIKVRIADIADENGIGDSFQDAYAVIHLAANASAGASWHEVIGTNIEGTKNVFEAARLAGVQKVIFASSNHVTGLYERDEPYRSIVTGKYNGLDPHTLLRIDHTMPIRPDGYYGISKAFGEAVGRYYAEVHGMQVVCLRIGTVNRENLPLDIRQQATLLMYADLVKMADKCLLAEDIGFEIFYGVSANTWRFWDTAHIRDCLGWEPEENAALYGKSG